MMDLATLLSNLSWVMASRVLTALGIGVITYAGITTVLQSAITAAKGAWAGLGADVLSLFTLAGVFEAMSISMGGIMGGVAFIAFKRLGLIATGT